MDLNKKAKSVDFSISYAKSDHSSNQTGRNDPSPNQTTSNGPPAKSTDSSKKEIDDSLKYFEIDGIKKVIDAKTKSGKIFWISLIVIAASITVYEVVKSVKDYYNSPTVTTYKIMMKDKIDFPQIYICPNNIARRSYIEKYPEKYDLAQTFRTTAIVAAANTVTSKRTKRAIDKDIMNDDEDIVGYFDPDAVVSQYLERQPRDANNQSTRTKNLVSNESGKQMIDNIMEMGISIEDFFVACLFHSNGLKPIPCKEIIKPAVDIDFGKCFIIDVGRDRKQVIQDQGLSLFINLNSDEYPKYPNNASLIPRYFGVYVTVAKQIEPVSWDRLVIPSNAHSKIDIRGQHLKFMNVKSGPQKQLCNEGQDFTYRVLNLTYSRRSCQLDCYLREVVDRCNCLNVMDKIYLKTDVFEKHHFCSVNEIKYCIQENVTNSNDTSVEIQKCSEGCLIPCDSWKFQTKVSSMPLNNRAFPKSTNHTKFGDLMYLQFAFPYLEYEEYTQDVSMTINSMIANIGGQIGLWVGASMLTLIQIPITLTTLSGWHFYTKATPAIKEAGRKITRANLKTI